MLRRQKGFTLIEFLVGVSLMLFLFANGLLVYTVLVKSFSDAIVVNKLDQQLRSALIIMGQDIRRAGYTANADNSVDTNTNANPFMASGVDISSPSSSCILFSYDSDSSGTLPALGAANYDKRFAFRLSNNTLQSRALTDSNFACTGGSWVNISDPNQVSITNLTFTLTPTVVTLSNGVSTLTIRNVSISLSGRLVQDSTVTRTVTENIRVRNDKFQP